MDALFVSVLLAVAPFVATQFPNDEVESDRNFQERSTMVVQESCLNFPVAPGNRVNTTDRLRRLRLRMKASNYDAYIVPSGDEHQSEYITDHDKRRQFVSGFSGSAGTAIVLQDIAALWTDGRYFLQAEAELDCNWLLMKMNEVGTPSLDDWIIQNLKAGSNIGADSKLVPYHKWIYLKEKFHKANVTLHADSSNLIDDIWSIPQGRVPESASHIFIHDVKYSGKTWQQKMEEVMSAVNKTGASGIIITALDEIMWLFNLRGRDSDYIPIFKAYAFVSEFSLRLYIKSLKVTMEIEKYLCPKSSKVSECVQIVEYNKAFSDIESIINKPEKLLVSSSSSYAIVNLVPEDKRVLRDGPSTISVLKVIKNSVEIIGMKNAALRDSVAIVDFIAMLEEEVKYDKHWDEMKASGALTKYREEQELNQGESFKSISAFGANAAIIHYQPQISTNRNINAKHLYLLDSGGQYLDGTTDITRTFHFGEPNDFEVEAYTRVLMGTIDLITAVFPDGVQDVDLDILARRSLYAIGLNYLHGTGHGIGSFLSVHEGPILVSTKSRLKGYPMKPGMFLSNEPGFYAADKFGIRLETMMMVVKAYTPHQFNNNEYYTFEPVSFVPFEPKLIDLHLLTKKQKEWLNWYNMKTRNSVGLELRKQNRKRGFHWLLSKTEYIPVQECGNSASSISLLFSKSNFVNAFVSILVFLGNFVIC